MRDLSDIFASLRKSVHLSSDEHGAIRQAILSSGTPVKPGLFAYEKALIFDALEGFALVHPAHAVVAAPGSMTLRVWNGTHPFRHLRPFVLR